MSISKQVWCICFVSCNSIKLNLRLLLCYSEYISLLFSFFLYYLYQYYFILWSFGHRFSYFHCFFLCTQMKTFNYDLVFLLYRFLRLSFLIHYFSRWSTLQFSCSYNEFCVFFCRLLFSLQIIFVSSVPNSPKKKHVKVRILRQIMEQLKK